MPIITASAVRSRKLADLIHYAVAIAAINDLDLNRIMIDKDREASVKYHHDIDLETFLRTKEKRNG